MDCPGADPLLLGLAAGDERAFAVLYDRFAAPMYRVALRLLCSHQDAEDVVQDVFMAVVRSREKLAKVQDLAAYLFTAIHRAAGRRAVQRAKTPKTLPTEVVEIAAPPESKPSGSPIEQRLQQAIGALPREQQEVLALKIDGNLTFAQIAEILEVSMGTVTSRYRYALKKLKTSLGGTKVLVTESH